MCLARSVASLTLACLCAAAIATRPMAAAPRIPLCAGLTIVTAISEPAGDYETIKTIQSISDRGIALHVSAQRRVQAVMRNFTIRRTILPDDVKTATLYMHNFMPRAPITIPGSTALGTSAKVLHALKTTGDAEIELVDASNSALGVDRAVHPNVFDFRIAYRLRRSTAGPPTIPVLLDDARVELPVVRARGVAIAGKAEFAFLDDDDNPLTLALRLGSEAVAADGGDALRLQVIRISSRCDAVLVTPASADVAGRIERALADRGRIDVYDIYFDFNSDRLREESAPTLQEIEAMMRRHPEWRLSIEGHTDGIAGDAYNLDLSRRRAAAVKDALVAAHGVDAARLSTAGYGRSRPKDTNETLEGRARNRRVELVRQ